MYILKAALCPVNRFVIEELGKYDFVKHYDENTLEINVEDFFNNIDKINKVIGLTDNEIKQLKKENVEVLHCFYS